MSNLSEKFMENSSKFANELFYTVAKDDEPTKNIILSPLSIQTCVALAFAGANGETAKEIVNGLHLVSENKQEVGETFAHFLENYQSSPLVKVANKVYVHQQYKLNSNFKEITSKYFHSEADTLNVGDPQACANKINQWVEDKTNNKIKDLISPDNIDELTRLVLINAIYFKGNWAKKFDPENTMKEQFYYNENDSVEVDMMTQKSKFRYGSYDDLDATALELPYADSNLSMVILLPNKRTGLKELGQKLKEKSIFELSQNLYETEVTVMLPKFKVDYSIDLKPTLEKMGMGRMFSNSAEFNEMLESPEELKVSKVVHKAFIEVNEEGTEAAAATGMIMMMRCALVEELPTEFIADHPFIYVIWDKKNVLFAGKNVKFD